MNGARPSGKWGWGGPGRCPCIGSHVNPAHRQRAAGRGLPSGHGRAPADRLHRRRSRHPVSPTTRSPRRARRTSSSIVLDDTGLRPARRFGSDIATPHIDALAAGGARFNRFHVTSLCSPTRASFFTGRNHHAVGMGFLADIPLGLPRLPRPAAQTARHAAPPPARRRVLHAGRRQVAPDARAGSARPPGPSTAGRSGSGSSATTASCRATPTTGPRTWSATTTTSSRRAGPRTATT